MRYSLLFVSLLLAACAVGPDFKAPAAPKADSYAQKAGRAGPVLNSGADIPAQWWRLYRSDELDRLIRSGLKESPSLAAARASLRAAQEDYTSQGGPILYPTVNGSLKSERRKVTGVSFGQGGGFIYNLHTASVDVSYAFDPFGSGRRYLESLRAQVDYQGYQMEAAYLTLTANIVTTAISEASLHSQIKAAREIVQGERDRLKIVERQAQLGVVTDADVFSQRTTLAQSRTSVPSLEKQLARTQHQLSLLVGRFPGQPGPAGHAMPTFELSALHLPEQIPLSLPSELVHQRPDIRAAEAQLHQASALVGLATANLYPSLTISASFGRQAVKFGDLLTGPASGLWSIGGNILQPLFHGGELTARRRQALASFDAARAQYQQTVLQAFRDVADVLTALHSDAQALELQGQAESLSSETLELVQRQFDLGAAGFLSLLTAQQQFRQSHIAVVQARATLLADTAALFQAMGGGWQREGAYRSVAGDANFSNAWTPVNQSEMKHKPETKHQSVTNNQSETNHE
ncbi:MAG: efflux transporter outer membrane subunit [Mariprofundaceae bacterium]|nr:efflux transporter outer membrane subunit [Mariprofundaceae bacterium]